MCIRDRPRGAWGVRKGVLVPRGASGQGPHPYPAVRRPHPRGSGHGAGGLRRRARRSTLTAMSDSAATWRADERPMLDAFLDDCRAELRGTLDGLTEEQARRSLVPSLTTLLGLVKHATFVELVWFDEGITFRPRADFGFASSVDESFTLTDEDTIPAVLERYLSLIHISEPTRQAEISY